LSDDLEMKAIAAEYAVPAAAVLAIEAGCDGALICSGDHHTQAAALEAIVKAVEDERLRISRVEDSLTRQRRAKERFLAAGAAALREAWRDPSIAGVIGVRGGYGSAQILPLLDREEARRFAKPFVGYSDLTALLTFITLGCGIVAFHGPMIDKRLSRGAEGY